MVFVADDIAKWLIDMLAEAGRRKLTELVLGSEQERALHKAAAAAIRDTAAEASPSDRGQAGHIAMVVGEVFRNAVPAVVAGRETLLEEIQSGLVSQMAVLDDVTLTGTGKSSAEVLGVSGATLTQMLSRHLVTEITRGGSRGGPLAPLADQLNHDLTHKQGQRIADQLADLTDEVRGIAAASPGHTARPKMAAGQTGSASHAPAGQPLGLMTDPFALEVHNLIQLDGISPAGRSLPAYLPRQHDADLGVLVQAAAEGRSGIAVLVGGSSTGKTRACWEALTVLREQDPGWRLWHPIDPSRPEAALRGLPAVAPKTVVWLNEAQFYLGALSGGMGEQVAAGLRELVRDPVRGPVLVLATLWPSIWAELTAVPREPTDPRSQARELLSGHDIPVPPAMTPADLGRLAELGDPRLTAAAEGAQDGQVTQFLAGAPELLARYRNAPPGALALILAAMDAHRMGMRPDLPRVFLEAAAPGYLTDSQWDQLGENWIQQGLAYATAPCKGTPGPLTAIRPRPGPPRAGKDSLARGSSQPETFRLADFLGQAGHRDRQGQIPPALFWASAASHADPRDLSGLAEAALLRGLSRDSAQLCKNAVARGDPGPACELIYIMEDIQPADLRPAAWVAASVPLHDPQPVTWLFTPLRRIGASKQVMELAGRAAVHAPLANPGVVAELLDELRESGAAGQITTLLDRDPAASADLADIHATRELLDALLHVHAREQASILAHRAIAGAALDDPGSVAELADTLRQRGAAGHTAALLACDPAAHARLDDTRGVLALLRALREIGAEDQVAVLASRAVAAAFLHDAAATATLLGGLRACASQEHVDALLARDPASHAALENARGAAWLLSELGAAGAVSQVTRLLERDPAAPLSANLR